MRQRSLPAKLTGREGANLELIGHEDETLRGDLRRSLHDENEPSTEESSAGEEAEKEAALPTAQRRARRRVTRHLAEAVGLAGSGSSLLESRSVAPATLKTYREALELFQQYIEEHQLAQGSDENVDAALVSFFTAEFFRGKHPSRGERTLAALMMLQPEFSTSGRRRVPRAWRALRGWRKMTPAVTRKPLPWPFWAGMAVELVSSIPAMGVFTLMCVSTYCRPSELLSLRRCDLVAPSPGVLVWWSLLLFPEKVSRASKTSQFNDSMQLDDSRLFFLSPIWKEIGQS